jgi:hypothetical protein
VDEENRKYVENLIIAGLKLGLDIGCLFPELGCGELLLSPFLLGVIESAYSTYSLRASAGENSRYFPDSTGIRPHETPALGSRGGSW